MSNISYQQEFLVSCRQEAQELIQEHWEEIARNKEKIKLDPNWEAYEVLEEAGVFRIFTARADGKLVGYFAVLVMKHLHYKGDTFADNDVLFLKKEYRKGLTGVKLIKFAEACLRNDGVAVLNINTKAHKPFDLILSRLGYEQADRIYSKYLQGD